MKPLSVLFLDLNAYFASIEQAVRPELRGRPVGVAAVNAPSGTLIAASYEAKPFGVKTGVRVSDAYAMCPDLVVVEARPPMYVAYHKRIREAVETVLPVDRVHSIDEMSVRLLGPERLPENAREVAWEIKRAVREQVAENLTCSIGVAPNAFLAKLGTEIQKPDGLVILDEAHLPEGLFGLKLRDFPGINRAMDARLRASGIFTSEQLCTADRVRLGNAFGSVVGERWWYLLRGFEIAEAERDPKSLGHSHVLPPNLRTAEAARPILLRLAHKAAARLRASGFVAGHVSVWARGEVSDKASRRIASTSDTSRITDFVSGLWSKLRVEAPSCIGVTFHELSRPEAVTPSLFEQDEDSQLGSALDSVNRRFGKNAVFLAAIHGVRDRAEEKIAFQKIELFSEGKGDGAWSEPTSPSSECDPRS